MEIDGKTLKQIIVGSGLVKEPEFDDALRNSKELGKSLEDILIFRGLANQEDLSKLIADYYKVPYVSAEHLNIPDEVLALIPERTARTYKIAPISQDNGTLKVAMDNPGNVEALEFIKRHTGLSVIPSYANDISIKQLLNQYKRNIRVEFDQVIAENIKKAKLEGNMLQAAERLPVIKVLDTIFEYAIAERASDVHIELQDKEVVVRFRIDGILQDIIKLPRGIDEALIARIKILSNLKLDEKRVPQDGRYKFDLNEDVVSLRISIIPGFYGENVVMRLLRESARALSLEELGITGKMRDLVMKNIKKPNGMMLVTGPTGSGKTTTLYSVLNILNTVSVKICTIEDPIEYGINRVTQIQINPKTGLTFAAGLRALLRHDPDMIMVGEIRDAETAQIAVHAALTGHFVLSTLHTNNAPGTIPRILDMGVEPYLASSTINMVIAQRLVRKICNVCRTEYKPEQTLAAQINKDFADSASKIKFYKGKGCDECRDTGFSGRIGIYEILPVTEEIRGLIAARATTDKIRETAEREGMLSMAQDGIAKVNSGMTTIEEVLRIVQET